VVDLAPAEEERRGEEAEEAEEEKVLVTVEVNLCSTFHVLSIFINIEIAKEIRVLVAEEEEEIFSIIFSIFVSIY
jgi:hypothetical protein